MDFTDLEILTIIARTKNLSQAAEALHLSQSTVSKRVKNIEAEAGFVIFNRKNNGVTPTAAGKVLLDQAAISLEQMNRSLDLARNIARERVLKIAAPTAVAEIIFPKLITFLNQEKLAYEFHHFHSAEIEKLLLAGALDIGFKENPFDNHQLKQRTVFNSPIVLIKKENQPPIDALTDFTDFNNHLLLLYPWGVDFSKLVEKLLQTQIPQDQMRRIAPLAVVKQLLQVSDAAVFLPRFFVEKELQQQELIEVPTKLAQSWHYSIDVAYSQSHVSSDLVEGIIKILQ
ncbi:LysR family transcriptional regulator [Enterococcus sp. HY326]|uniref:LysR family transcriptional regulator n=1 Tax=Enterococcus sp. HY326 TaxID=2971265 RepID=UPI00223FBD84|nr:LysR family transcriptional regulator [Enterococcus sp. HY326]